MSEEATPAVSQKPSETAPVIQPNRRAVLKGILGLFAAIGLGSFFYGIWRFLAPDAAARNPVELSLDEVPLGGFYYLRDGGSPGILLREEDGNLRAFSLVCTHMACIVVWNPEKREFYCPCHDGYFDAQGKVLSGPPPTPLERWAVEVKGEKVIVGVG